MQTSLRKLVVFYSLEGNTRRIAGAIADEIEGELLELKPSRELPSKGFMRYIWGGGQVVMQRRPEMEPLEVAPQDYDLLFIGTPVWAFSYAPPLRSLFASVQLWGKEIALFCTHEGGPCRTLARMRKALLGNDILGEADFAHPVDEARAREWARRMLGRLF